MKILTRFITFLILFFGVASVRAQYTFVKRINCGSPSDLAYNGQVYESDGSAAGVTFDGELSWTKTDLLVDPAVQSIRFTKNTNREMFYHIDVPQAGVYEVSMHFVEPHWGISSPNAPDDGAGVRIFDVLVEGVLVADDLDVFVEVGAHAVYTLNYSVNMSSGDLTIDIEFDASGNDPIVNAIEVLGIAADTQAPTSPVLNSAGHSDTTADLSWSGATDNTGITGYKVFKDGTLEATIGNVSTYQVTGLTVQTTYQFTVKALDAASNESANSNVVSVTTDATSGGGSSTGVWNESGSDINYTAGNVGIGTNMIPAGYILAVEGKIISEELKVQLQSQWPDYVFMENYQLPDLEEVERFIRENGHLKNIPSEQEVKANGIEVGEMNRLLLEKIEELTLYVIQLHTEIETLKKGHKNN